MPRTGAIILAAGGSSRLGRPKQLLQFAGRTFVRRAIDAASGAGCDPIVVVLGAQYDSIAAEIDGLAMAPVRNTDWQKGIGTSVRLGLAALIERSPTIEEALILLCDQPLVNSDTLSRLLQAHRASGKPVCVSRYLGTLGPPVIVTASLFPQLLELPDAQGTKAIWSGRPQLYCEFPCGEAGFDIDTQDDLDRLSALR